jgi:hypothetical protein
MAQGVKSSGEGIKNVEPRLDIYRSVQVELGELARDLCFFLPYRLCLTIGNFDSAVLGTVRMTEVQPLHRIIA